MVLAVHCGVLFGVGENEGLVYFLTVSTFNNMKKSLFLLAFLLLAGRGFSQIADSAAVVKQVDSLIQVSRGLTDKREFDKALEVNGVAEKLALEKFGRETVAYGSACFNHGRVLYRKVDYLGAEKWYLDAMSIRKTTLGNDHPKYAETLQILAFLYVAIGKYEKAELLHLESKSIWEKSFGKEHKDYASSLNNLGYVYQLMGKYEKAEPLYLEFLGIMERITGKENPNYCAGLINLATMYRILGNYENAEVLYQEAKGIFETQLHNLTHPFYLTCLNNLAILYNFMGDDEKSESIFLEVLVIREKIEGKEQPEYAESLNNLAAQYRTMRKYEKAEPLYLEAKAICEKSHGKEHPNYTATLTNLANLNRDIGKYEKSELLYKEAIATIEKNFNSEEYEYSASLEGLALLYQVMGKYENAKFFFQKAKSVVEKTLGTEHPFIEESLSNLAMLYWTIDSFDTASTYFTTSCLLQKSLLAKSIRHLSERELSLYVLKFANNLTPTFSFTQSYPDLSPTCYDNALFHKGFLLNAATRVNSPMLRDSAATETFYRLKAYNRRLATEYTKPIAERKGVEELEAQANDLEKELTRTVAGYSEALRQVKWQEVQAALKPGEAAIEFVHYRFWNKKQTDSVMYAALVLLPGVAPPRFIPLFEEKQLESLLQRGTEPYEVHIKTLYAHTPSGTGKPQKTLYELIWQPLETVFNTLPAGEGRGGATVYFSPSGLLHRLSLAAIPVSATATLADRHTLVEFGSTRSLVAPPSLSSPVWRGAGGETVSPPPGGLEGAILFGGIQYDMDSTAVIQANAGLPTETPTGLRRTLSFSQTDSTLRGGSWKYLPGSEKEVANAEKIMQESGLKTSTLRGYAATEEAFKSIGLNAGRVSNPSSVPTSPRILHLATHGFFFPDPKTEVRGEGLRSEGSDPVFKMSDNPLIRAGLIMAGGNHAWKTGQPIKPGMDDGILTAYEISQMNLSNTELVVLSACETGLGDIQGNEGVYGLQRAFKIAGAKYVIMSLWQVPDQQTARLMTLFYKKWLTEKMAVPEAFRAAQNELRGRGFDPFYWAGFVLVE